MNLLECTARLIAAEQGLDQSEWEQFKELSRTSLRRIPLTDAEMTADSENGRTVLKLGIKLLRTTEGRYEMLDRIEAFRAKRAIRN